MKKLLKYLWSLGYLFKTYKDIGVGDDLPKGKKMSDLDSLPVYTSRKQMKRFIK